ncbi:MAG: hypothetical protein ABIN93_02110 [Ginsengibacter sp.]
MSFNIETLYKLLPAFNQIRDVDTGNNLLPGEEHDGPLKALLSLVAEQLAVLEENFEQLYDDQFIETCAEWVVPYIGDLVGARGLTVFPGASFSERGEVANTLSYRRRKGTASIIEQLARDVTGWNASVVEYFQLLATTQYLNHLRPGNLSMASLRDWEVLEYLNTPFDKVAHTVDVRNISRRRGKYNIPNIGIFLWRLDSFSLRNSPAFQVDDRRFKFDALGKDTPLYNKPVPEPSITHLSDPVNVPIEISRRILRKHLSDYYGIEKSMLIYNDGDVILPEENTSESLSAILSICNLSDLKDINGDVVGWVNMPQNKIAIDPVLGRIAFPASAPPPINVHVDYHYGFSDKMGGGDYGRTSSFFTDLEEVKLIRVPQDKATIQAALIELETTGGVVEITNNEYYIETPIVKIAAGKKIEMRAADKMRPVLVLDGDMEILGLQNAELHINGLLISGGRLRLPVNASTGETNELRKLFLQHCTLLPGASPAIGNIPGQPAHARLFVTMSNVIIGIDKCILGALQITDEATVHISNSIIDAGDESKMAYSGINDVKFGATLKVENSTIIGKVKTVVMELASNTIFYAANKISGSDASPVLAERLQEGCVRFSYVTPGSRLPRQYHCRPEKDDTDPAGVRPVFTSLKYGSAAYCQLSQLSSSAIRQGADDEAEMGAFHKLYQPQRKQNLQTRLNEYLRFGLEAGIYYAS